ncbi:MAG: hypothetical protein ABH867_04910 [Patescibacteria group bacterium]
MKKVNFLDWLFFLGLFLIFLIPATDPDLGWQLRCGQEIWQNHTLCSLNHFSVLLPDYAWPNHHWLYQSLLFPIYQVGGLWGLTFFNAILLTLTFLLFYHSIRNFNFEKRAAIIITVLLSVSVFSLGIRSQLTGLLFLSAVFWTHSKTTTNHKYLFFYPLIMLLWANFHGSFVLGLILIACFIGIDEMTHLTNHRKIRLFSLTILSVSALITLVNPFGIRIYEEAWRHIGGVDLSKLIAEWVPPAIEIWLLVFGASVALFFWLLFKNQKQQKLLAFLLLPFSFLALSARRNLPYFFLTAFFLFLTSPATQKLMSNFLARRSLRKYLSLALSLLLLIIGLTINLPRAWRANHTWPDFCLASPLNFPYSAVEYLKTQSSGNIFNRYEWGGFLIWQLPQYKIFVDGRMPAWPTSSGKSPYTIFLEILQTQPGWNESLKEYSIDWILINPGTFMNLALKDDPQQYGWEEKYRDEISVVYQRVEK